MDQNNGNKRESKILVVEDESSLMELLKVNLTTEGYQVEVASDGPSALETFSSRRFDLIVLDIMLPGMDGLTVCRKIRAENQQVPILFLSAKNEAKDRIEGLRTGGDDHLGKPFELDEFLLRVERLLERATSEGSEKKVPNRVFWFGGNSIDFEAYEAKNYKQQSKQLSKRELMLLKLLVDHRDRVVSREKILESIWGFEVYPSTRTIDNFILEFRKFFEKTPKKPVYFHSVRGVGYKFTPGSDHSFDKELEE
ncbi:MAG: response regulator transcription factor [Flavobacteriales bacterium]